MKARYALVMLLVLAPGLRALAEDEDEGEGTPVGNNSTAEGMGTSDGDGTGEVVEENEGTRAAHNPNSGKVAAAETERKRRIAVALPRLRTLRADIAAGRTPDAHTIAAVRSWWWLGPTQLPTVAQMDRAITLIERNRDKVATVNVYPDPVTVRCDTDPPGDGSTGSNYACAEQNGTRIYLRKLLMDNNANCQAGVLTHEYFHLVGPNHAGGDACNSQRSMEDVLNNNNCMGGVICAVAGVANCGNPCT